MIAAMPGIGQGRGGGRKVGTTYTESSTFYSRLKTAMGISIEKLAREIGVSEKTGRNYNNGIIPKSGSVREKLEDLGRTYGVPIEEPEL